MALTYYQIDYNAIYPRENGEIFLSTYMASMAPGGGGDVSFIYLWDGGTLGFQKGYYVWLHKLWYETSDIAGTQELNMSVTGFSDNESYATIPLSTGSGGTRFRTDISVVQSLPVYLGHASKSSVTSPSLSIVYTPDGGGVHALYCDFLFKKKRFD